MTKKDLIVTGTIIFIAALIGLFNWFFTPGRGDSLVIIYKNELLENIKLPAHRNIIIDKGIHKWEVEINDYKARIVSADCPTRRCVDQGWIEKGGEALICVPQHFLLRFEKENEIDAVTQ